MKNILLTLLLCISPITFSKISINGDLTSFEKAFTELLKSDGGSAEDLNIEIGKMIKTHPTNFLKTLKKHEDQIKRLDALVGNFGYELVDDFEATKIEAKARIKALEKVAYRSTDPELKRLAKKCIDKLGKF